MDLLMKRLLLGLLVSLQVESALALGYATTFSTGNGCPPGTTSFVTSPDGEAVTVLFDQFVAAAGGPLALSDFKTCQLEIPIAVSAGYTLGVYKVDYRGYLNLPHQAKALLQVDYSLAGLNSPQFHRQFVGTQNQNFIVTDTIGAGAFRFVPCGGNRIIPLQLQASWNLQLKAQGGSPPQAVVALDSLDGAAKGGIVYHFKAKKCQ